MRLIKNKSHNNWKTPDYLYQELNKEFLFDFDPCPLYYGTLPPPDDRNGLIIEWGQRNFVNPPYSRKLKEAFVKRAIYFKERGKTSVVLIPVSTSTALYHDHIVPNADEIRFLRGRVKFEGLNNKGQLVKGVGGMHDSMVVVFKGCIDHD